VSCRPRVPLLATDAQSAVPRREDRGLGDGVLLNTQLASWAELRHDTISVRQNSRTAAAPRASFPRAVRRPISRHFMRRLARTRRAGSTATRRPWVSLADAPRRGASHQKSISTWSWTSAQRLGDNGHSGANRRRLLPPEMPGVHPTTPSTCSRTVTGKGRLIGSRVWYRQLFFNPRRGSRAVAHHRRRAPPQPMDEVGKRRRQTFLHVGNRFLTRL